MNVLLETKDIKVLLDAIESNLDDFYIKCTYHPDFDFMNNDKISWVRARYVDWPNCIFKVNFEGLDLNSEIIKVKTLIESSNSPNAWTLGPLSKPLNLGSKLEEVGFTKVYQQAGMVLYLQDLNNLELKSNELKVKLVDSWGMLQQWSNLVSLVFNIRIDQNLLKYLLNQTEALFYIGYSHGIPVSTLLLYLSSGVAGLHAVSTHPGYRNKGFGFLISGIALKEALKLGYKVGVLQASKMGERIYKKLRFKKQCDIFSYELQGLPLNER
ncbi:MAG: GNAT family N-acetyltransferase [Promethearchaeota archaeon]